jgi:hypothetical protein
MSSSNGGGRKRGRPVILTPEQRLERERERWRRKQARKRKAAQDAAWRRDTISGYFVQLSVPHYNRLTEALVGNGYLGAADVDIASRVDAAADKVFEDLIKYDRWLRVNRPFGLGSSACTVRVRMTQELACKLADHEYATRFPLHTDERVEDCRKWCLEAKAIAAYEQRKPLFLRVPTPAFWDDAECLARLREAEAERDEIRRRFRTPEEFKEEFLQNRGELTRAAERYLSRFSNSYVPNLPWVACNCKLALPECDCLSRFRPKPGAGVLKAPPKPERPRGKRPLVKRDLYSGSKQRWWTTPRYDDDPIIRSHDKSASVGMKGFYAGTKGVWWNDKAEYFPEQDDRASTRDRNKTARQGEKELTKPYDNPEGTPKSWSNPSDVEPDNEDGIKRIGKRLIEETVIAPPDEED